MAYLVDVNKIERLEKRRKTLMYLDFASKLVLFEPNFRSSSDIIEPSHWKWWRYNETPHFSELKSNYKSLKFFINKFYSNHHKIWNPSFILGLSEAGTLIETFRYSIVFDIKSISISKIFRDSPFPFEITEAACPYKMYCKNLTILNMEKSKDNLSYMAGVFATGDIKTIKNIQYISYSKKIKPIFEQWRIPIETQDGMKVYINPFWPAMLEEYMPEFSRIYSKLDIKNGSAEKDKAKEYASIVWRAYSPNLLEPIDIPYLPSRRCIYKKFNSEKLSTSKFLEDLRFKYKLMNLDPRFKSLIHAKNMLKT